MLPAGTCLRTPLSPSSRCPLPSLHPPCSPSPPQGPPRPLHTRIPTGNGAAPPLPQPWRTPGPRCVPQPLFPLGWGTSQPCGTSASRGVSSEALRCAGAVLIMSWSAKHEGFHHLLLLLPRQDAAALAMRTRPLTCAPRCRNKGESSMSDQNQRGELCPWRLRAPSEVESPQIILYVSSRLGETIFPPWFHCFSGI